VRRNGLSRPLTQSHDPRFAGTVGAAGPSRKRPTPPAGLVVVDRDRERLVDRRGSPGPLTQRLPAPSDHREPLSPLHHARTLATDLSVGA